MRKSSGHDQLPLRAKGRLLITQIPTFRPVSFQPRPRPLIFPPRVKLLVGLWRKWRGLFGFGRPMKAALARRQNLLAAKGDFVVFQDVGFAWHQACHSLRITYSGAPATGTIKTDLALEGGAILSSPLAQYLSPSMLFRYSLGFPNSHLSSEQPLQHLQFVGQPSAVADVLYRASANGLLIR
jgi:hypothetical protein